MYGCGRPTTQLTEGGELGYPIEGEKQDSNRETRLNLYGGDRGSQSKEPTGASPELIGPFQEIATVVWLNKFMKPEKLSSIAVFHPDESNGKVVSQSCIPAPKQRHVDSSLRAISPDSKRLNVEENHDSSPFQMVHCLDSTHVNLPSSTLGNSSETPKEALFDSFAPGPDKITFAPHNNKYGEAPLSNVIRCLDFSCATDLLKDMNQVSKLDSERLLEISCGTIPDASYPEQARNLVPRLPVRVTDSYELGSPVSAPSLCGVDVDQTCPGAPMKPKSSRYKTIPNEICRKLEF